MQYYDRNSCMAYPSYELYWCMLIKEQMLMKYNKNMWFYTQTKDNKRQTKRQPWNPETVFTAGVAVHQRMRYSELCVTSWQCITLHHMLWQFCELVRSFFSFINNCQFFCTTVCQLMSFFCSNFMFFFICALEHFVTLLYNLYSSALGAEQECG